MQKLVFSLWPCLLTLCTAQHCFPLSSAVPPFKHAKVMGSNPRNQELSFDQLMAHIKYKKNDEDIFFEIEIVLKFQTGAFFLLE